jgi:HAE1 family hydrophobic/amphiphilic exporter-1
MSSQTGGKDCAAIGIFLQPGANALQTAQRVKNRMAELQEAFPPGLAYEIPFDTTIFVEASIDEVVQTLFIAVVLVFVTVLMFLQNWRATLIPAATIPVSLIGTFAAMAALDVSINMLSLFGLVLAIGVVVDDAIVVVENASRNINESGLSPKEATIKAMKEVSGPIIATTLVLLAVFVPTAFLGVIMMAVFAGLTILAFYGFGSRPKGFVPNEDQGWAMYSIQLPDAASRQRTLAVVEKLNQRLAEMPGIRTWVAVPGYSLMDEAITSNAAAIWTVFDPWEERLPAGLTQEAILGQMWGAVADIQEALIFAFAPPPIMGLGTAGGFEMQVQDRNNLGLQTLQSMTTEITNGAFAHPKIQMAYSTFRANVPQLQAHVDRSQTKSMGIDLSNVFDTLQANMGSVYVNDFNKFGHTYQVRVQADAPYRADVDDILRLQVRNDQGEMVPLGTMVDVSETIGPQIITRYNMYPAAKISGQGTPDTSSGESMAVMEQFADKKLPASMSYEWTGMSYQEKAAAGQTILVFTLAVLFVYLVLCAQYESWSLPLAVILAVPLGLLGTVAAVAVRGMEINVYTQIGIVLLIALTCKTAILIAEFAKAEHEAGENILDAAIKAAVLRFRPILMTAFTFILGVVPLVIATGAGAAGRQALGTAVFGGMISATTLLVLFVPLFYVLVQKTTERVRPKAVRMVEPVEEATI